VNPYKKLIPVLEYTRQYFLCLNTRNDLLNALYSEEFLHS